MRCWHSLAAASPPLPWQQLGCGTACNPSCLAVGAAATVAAARPATGSCYCSPCATAACCCLLQCAAAHCMCCCPPALLLPVLVSSMPRLLPTAAVGRPAPASCTHAAAARNHPAATAAKLTCESASSNCYQTSAAVSFRTCLMPLKASGSLLNLSRPPLQHQATCGEQGLSQQACEAQGRAMREQAVCAPAQLTTTCASLRPSDCS